MSVPAVHRKAEALASNSFGSKLHKIMVAGVVTSVGLLLLVESNRKEGYTD